MIELAKPKAITSCCSRGVSFIPYGYGVLPYLAK